MCCQIVERKFTKLSIRTNVDHTATYDIVLLIFSQLLRNDFDFANDRVIRRFNAFMLFFIKRRI